MATNAMLRFENEADKQKRLDEMRRLATGLLLLSAVVLLLARYLEIRYRELGYLRAAAEAALIGGIADWFAVTALFRHPLGLKIPHTAIVSTRKDRIGRSLGRFVESNFLAPEVLASKLESIRVAEWLAEWLQRPESSDRLVSHAVQALRTMVQSLDDREMEALIQRQVVSRAAEIEASPLVSKLLSQLLAPDRRQRILDTLLSLIQNLLEENRENLRERVEREIPWWVPAPIDEKIFLRVYSATEKSLQDVLSRPDHTFRQRFDELIQTSLERLESSPELIARGEQLKEELLHSSAIESLAERTWLNLKEALSRDSGSGNRAAERAIKAFGESLQSDEALLRTVNGWVRSAILYAAQEYRHEAALLIETTVAKWDPEETSERIELQVGRDLQFIRINGTIVGGLVGLILYALEVLW